jgi:hypothetical protein
MHLMTLLCLELAIFSSLALAERHTHFENSPLAEIVAAATEYNPVAIIELGLRREKSSMALLRQIAQEPDIPEPAAKRSASYKDRLVSRKLEGHNKSHHEARIALARMGDEKYFKDFIGGLSSPDPSKRAEAIWDLTDIGDKRAVKFLIPLLDDDGTPPASGEVLRPPIRFFVEDALEKILPDVRNKFVKDSQGRGTTINTPGNNGRTRITPRMKTYDKGTLDATKTAASAHAAY